MYVYIHIYIYIQNNKLAKMCAIKCFGSVRNWDQMLDG